MSIAASVALGNGFASVFRNEVPAVVNGVVGRGHAANRGFLGDSSARVAV